MLLLISRPRRKSRRYGGVNEDNVFDIEADDVKLDDMIILHSGFKYDLYKEGIPAIRSCKEDDSFVIYNDNYNIGYTEIVRTQGNLLLRRVKSKTQVNSRSTMTAISHKQREAFNAKQISFTLRYYQVWRSGVYYREWMREKQGKPRQDFADVAERMAQTGSRSYNENQTASLEDKKKRFIRELVKGYKQWKIAHNL